MIYILTHGIVLEVGGGGWWCKSNEFGPAFEQLAIMIRLTIHTLHLHVYTT